MSSLEIPLTGGQSTAQVVRIGDTVHRTLSPKANLVHPLLRHLESRGFPYAPRLLGLDDQGREVLSFIEGEVPRKNPLTFSQKSEAIRVLRTYHDLAADAGLSEGEETVCHFDFAPWNIIVHNEKVVGIIDFDDAAPGRRIDDLAYAVWTFLDLGTAPLSNQEQISQVVQLISTYGPIDAQELSAALLRQQQRILSFRERMAREAEEEGMRRFSAGAILRIRQSMDWVATHAGAITELLDRQ